MPKRCPRRSSSPCPGLPYFSDCGWRATGTAAVFSTMRIARYLGAGGPGNMQHVRHRRSAFRRGLAPARSPRLASTRAALSLPHLRSADRKSLLLGTARASTLLLVVCSHLRRLTLSIALLRPRRLRGHPVRLLSFRQSTTLSPAPTPRGRFNNPALLQPGAVIRLSTLANSTTSISTAASDATVAYAISALTQGSASPVSVVNSGNILVITTGVMGAVNGYGING